MDHQELVDLVKLKIENIRPRLLDLSRRNPLIATKLSPGSNAHIRVVDELPEVLFYKLSNSQAMRLIPLPEIDEDPRDEEAKGFQDALANARLTDDTYLAELDRIDRDADDYLDRARRAERALKDRVRDQLGMAPRPKKAEINLVQHARNNGITPSYELPMREDGSENQRHADDDIQTLLLPKDLERKLNGINSKCRTWLQETGINVLHVAYGFVEWSEPNQTETAFAPLILATAQLEKRRTPRGSEFWLSGAGEEPESNAVLAEKLKIDFGIELPAFDGISIEEYFVQVAKIAPRQIVWRVRRQIAIGVFPSARMAMYHDLDPSDPKVTEPETVRTLLVGAASEIDEPFADEYDVDKPEFENCVPCIVMDADSSQFSTLVDIANEKNVAVEGPPGTGKSQTIVNAIAAALHSGKKVLFVAEKLAALNVVRSRLESIGLGEFLLPLQAERSTREQVINSVRTRVEMRPPPPVRDYDAQVQEYRRVRDELTRYIDILKQPVPGTGLTVYEVLSKSIATADNLTGLPVEVLERCEIARSYLSSSGLNELAEIISSAERAHVMAQASSDAWKATKLLRPDRFTVESACGTARRAAEVFRKLAHARKSLTNYSLIESGTVEQLDEIRVRLVACAELPASVQPLLVKLLDPGVANLVHAFLQSCNQCIESTRSLERDVAEVSRENLAGIEAVQASLQSADLETLSRDRLEDRLQSSQTEFAHTTALERSLEPLVAAIEEAQRWRLSDIALARRAVVATGRPALSIGHPALAEATATIALKRLCAQLRWLQSHRTNLQTRSAMATPAEPDVLTQSAAVLRSAGALRVLSAGYRGAKRLARSLSLNPKFDRFEAATLFDELATFRRNERTFLGDTQAPMLFGAYFRGIETDPEPFERLVKFHEYINSIFVTNENHGLRNFLRREEIDLVSLLPDCGPSAANYRDFCAVRNALTSCASAIEKLETARSALDKFSNLFRDPAKMRVDALPSLPIELRKNLDLRQSLDTNADCKSILGSDFCGWRTHDEKLLEAVEWARTAASQAAALQEIIRTDKLTEAQGAISLVLDLTTQARRLHSELQDLAKIEIAHFATAENFETIADTLERAAGDADGLFNHAAMATIRAEIDQIGLGDLLDYRLAHDGNLTHLSTQVEAIAARALAKQVYAAHRQSLTRFTGIKLNELRAAVANKDREVIKLSRQYLKHKAYSAARPPRGNGMGKKSTWTQLALIENEIGKQQRFISVRDLTERAGKALTELKPCWMMSPLAVAQYVKKDAIQFDLCIIDEASQMPPEAAVGTLLRSKQAVIVGDTNQLPPTSFFKKLVEDEEIDEDETVLDESILEMANSTFRPPRRLRWHYRSRHSGLIKFSNRLIYEDDLVVFPSANELLSRMGVHHRHVNGLYKSGTNAIEARTIVDAIVEFMRNDPDRSLGVVTLNQKQRDLISEEFEQALTRNLAAQSYVESWKSRNDGLEEFFIKNLENVQGDERDVIFIGTVYGPESAGARVMQRFGPINGLAGRRRLNVLFSRAKEKIVTFSSMTAADILADDRTNAGAYMLKRWLEYSASGMLEGAGARSAREPDSEFEVYVIDQVRAMGCEPVPQVGAAGYFIDIGVKHPDWPYGFLLGVECDGASYHSSKSARDRDRLREEVLLGLGWKLHRIWSTDWFNSPRREAERLRNAISARLAELKAREAEFSDSSSVDDAWSGERASNPHGSPAQSSSGQQSATRPLPLPSRVDGVAVGDTVRVRYADDANKTIQVTISNNKSDPQNGIVYFGTPIARALLGAEEGDEVEVLVGSYVHRAIVESIQKAG